MPDLAILITDRDFIVQRHNALALTAFGPELDSGEPVSLMQTSLWRRLKLDNLQQAIQLIEQGEFWEKDFDLLSGEGKKIVRLVVSDLHTHSGESIGYIVMARDVTARLEQDKSVLEQQRLQSVGLLAGGVAHDFNNILMGILGYASLAKDRLETTHPAQRMLNTIEQSAERAAELTRALLAYARGGKLQSSPVMLEEQMNELLGILGTNLPKGVVVTKRYQVDLPYVMADPAQIQQVIMNICLNAGEAIAQKIRESEDEDLKGELVISTGTEMLDSKRVRDLGLPVTDLQREFVYLSMSDNGCGMSEETRRRIFEPFFTTKFAGRGLGLAAVEGIVRNHGGALTVESVMGEGSKFTILLPAAGRLARVEEELLDLPLGAGETILVVDDEEIVRQLALLTLTNLGYDVMLARDGAEGLDAFKHHADRVQMVLLDITMPGRDAASILREFVALKPGIAVLVTSGYDESAATGLVGNNLAAAFLHKPYTPDVLARAVRSVLDKLR